MTLPVFVHYEAAGLKRVARLMATVTENGSSDIGLLDRELGTLQATIVGDGTVTGTVSTFYSNDLLGWIPGDVLELLGVDVATAGFTIPCTCIYIKVILESLTGVGAEATVSLVS
jgi:hypothetical protein